MKRLISLLLSAIIMATMFILPSTAEENAEEWKTAAEVVADMKCGWNLGHVMDLYTAEGRSYENRITEIKLTAEYFTNPYDDIWNPSPEALFSKDGKAELVWETSSIASKDSAGKGPFLISINCYSLYENAKIEVKFTKALFEDENGKTYDLGMLGTQKATFSSDGRASFGICNFDDDMTTGQIKKGKIKVNAEILNIDEINETCTKEEYYEHYWGNRTLVGNALIDKVAKKGFGAVRIPVTYLDFTDPETYEIDEQRLARLEELIKYTINSGMYCIINMSGDCDADGWLKASPAKLDSIKKRFAAMWTQIAERLGDFGEKLIFEGFNNIMNEYRNWAPTPEEAAAVNALNQTFVDSVRACGGNNSKRVLIVTPYTSEAFFLDSFAMPKDTVEDRLIVGVHDRSATDFAWTENGHTAWDTEKDTKLVDEQMTMLNLSLVSKGIPVIITEFSSANKNNTAERVKHASYFAQAAAKYRIVPLWYDDATSEPGNEYEFTTALITHSTQKWVYEDIANAFVEGSGSEVDLKSDISLCEVSKVNDREYTGKYIKPSVRLTYYGNLLRSSTDYTIKYSKNKSIGKATITINGKGEYSGTIKINFYIIPPKARLLSVKSTTKGKAVIKLKKTANATGYEIAYCKTKNGEYKSATTTTKLTKTFKIPSGAYYVKVRAYKTVNGEKIYSYYSGAQQVDVK